MGSRRALALLLCAFGLGCSSNDDPASYVTGLRVLAIKAEPPDIAVGAAATVTALVSSDNGAAVDVVWQQCVDPPLSGDAINLDCITQKSADFLQTVGDGLSVVATMPAAAATLTRPDSSGGLYLPLIARASAGADAVTASYLLRLNQGMAANNNPALSELFVVSGNSGETLTAVDDATPLVVSAKERITLRAAFVPGSAEVYQIDDTTGSTTTSRTVTETLSVSWFATAGTFADAQTGSDVPDTVWHLDQTSNGPSVHLPASGQTIDLWAVGRDERGGTDYLHRTVQFQ